MYVPRFGHLAYSKRFPERHRFSLASSAIASSDLAALGLPHQAPMAHDLTATLEPLERALGARNGAPGGRVLTVAGASEGIAIVALGLCDPGGEMLVESFGYEPHRETPRMLRIPTRTFTRTGRAGEALAAEVERALSPRTRVVVVSDLHNPTGARLEEPAIAALDELARDRGLWLVCDETFRDAAERPLGTLASRSERWVALSTLTKVYGLGGLRLGWIAGSAEALARCADSQHALSVHPALLSAALTLALMPHLDTLRARGHAFLRENHARWREFAASHPGADPSPNGTTTWFRLEPGADGDAFTDHASRHHELAFATGHFFGDSGGVRIGLGLESASFAAALERFAAAVDSFEPASLRNPQETS